MARWDSDNAHGSQAEVYCHLGLRYATGQSVEIDLVTAHKWFNIAALKGCAEAIRLRREIAAEMSDADIAAAQRAARDWLSSGEPALELRVAA